MTTTRFCVELDKPRATKLQVHLATNNLTGRKFIENTIDRLRPALGSICATPKRKSK